MRLILLPLLVAGAAGLGLRFAKPAAEHIAMLSVQRRCMSYVEPRPSVPAFGGNLILEPANRQFPGRPGFILYPEWGRFLTENPDLKVFNVPWSVAFEVAGRIPPCWQELMTYVGTLTPKFGYGEEITAPYGTVFVGTLRTPKGEAKLVAVNVCEHCQGKNGPEISFLADIVSPAGPLSRASRVQGFIPISGTSRPLPALWRSDVKIYFGQVVPADRSTFASKITIGPMIKNEFEQKPRDGRLIGKLVDVRSFQITLEGFDDLNR